MTQPAAAAEVLDRAAEQDRREPVEPIASTLDRLRVPAMTDRLVGWVTTLVITAIAFVVRAVDLGSPNKFVFDETYYAKDAWSLLLSGYERSWPSDANAKIIAGSTDVIGNSASFIVHPQLGKWLIAVGEHFFGFNPVGWRVMPLIFGTLLVMITIRLARRLSRSTVIGGIAGLLLAFDGLAVVLSRTALLDGFMALFLVAAVACLVADRDWFRNRLADHLQRSGLSDLGGQFGPALIIRPWRLGAGVLFGLALGTKWSTLYVLAAFALLSLAWDVGARRLAGGPRFGLVGLFRDGIPAFVSLVLLSGVVYVSTWASWLVTKGGWARGWGDQHPNDLTVRLLGKPLASLLQYHREMWGFHTGSYINHATHPYDAKPIGWLLITRPTAMSTTNDIPPGTRGCAAVDKCLSVVVGIGTPALWWAAVFALIAAIVLWIGARDWRFGVPVVGVLAAWLPWFQYDTRPVFYFYAIALVPFSVIAVALCLGRILGPANSGDRRMIGAILTGSFVALVAADFAYIYPIVADQPLSSTAWRARMWFRSWI